MSPEDKKKRERKKFLLDLVRGSVAELLGTALYVFIGASSVSNYAGNDQPQLPTVALAYGFSFAGLSASMHHLSGGHFNPAVTVGVFVAGGIHILLVMAYIVSQIVGGVIGASFVLIYQSALEQSLNMTDTLSSNGESMEDAVTVLPDGIRPEMGIAVEMLLTLLFVTVFIHTSMEDKFKPTSPALCGLTLAAAIIAGYRITGGSLNPARSFSTVLVSGHERYWRYHYVYWVGPLIGGCISGALHRVLLSSKALLSYKDTEEDQWTRIY